MTKKIVFVAMALAIVLMLLAPGVPTASAAVLPDTLTATLAPGESINVTDAVTIPTRYPAGDVIFSFDLTGSMIRILNTAKAKTGEIMTTLGGIPDVNLQYGVVSYMDYPNTYSNSCGYGAQYGDPSRGDYAYGLNQSVTDNTSAVSAAINSLRLGYGADGPQDYTRVMYESYADPNIGWQPGAARILVNFADNVPHDCDINEGVPGATGIMSTGGDPGRDEVMGTADDLDLQTVLAGMAANGVTMIECHSANPNMGGLMMLDYWKYWTGITGGNAYLTASASLSSDVVTAISNALLITSVTGLHLQASAGYEAWLASITPASYANVTPGSTVNFNITIQVPEGTVPGTYNFTISALDDVGVNYGTQAVTITVTEPPSARSLKEHAIQTLESAKPGQCCIDFKIDGVICLIKKSLADCLWIDDTHLNPCLGTCVFLKEYAAVLQMQMYMGCWNSLPAGVQAAFKQAIDDLVAADKMLAEVAVSEARAYKGKNCCVDMYLCWAEKSLQKGYTLTDKLCTKDDAITCFMLAWGNAEMAIRCANGDQGHHN